jgi:nucleotide-binding universal stress UspA family protein
MAGVVPMYERILVAIDGSRTADLALTEAVKLAQTHGSTLRIVHVIDARQSLVGVDSAWYGQMHDDAARGGRDILAEAEAFARNGGLNVETRLLEIERTDHNVVDVLAEEAKAWPADLVVIGTHGRRGLNRLLLGSVADQFVRVAGEPVLLVRETQAE